MVNFSFVKYPRKRACYKSKAPALQGCPQKRAVVIKSFETTPRKPNSAKRRVAKVFLSNLKRINVYLEGMGLNKLQPHSVVLVRGRGPRDLPGVRYHAIRGVKDFVPLTSVRTKARSKYGVKKSADTREKLEKGFHRFLQYPCRKHLRN
jgi:small subunit ribosomal protein S12